MKSSIQDRLKHIFGDCHNAGPATDEQIQVAERQIALVFPPSFRTFLSTYGASSFQPPYTIAGIVPEIDPDETPEWESVSHANQARRMKQDPRLIYFTSDGCDCQLYLDSRNPGDDGEYPVIALGPGFDDVRNANSFVEFAEEAMFVDPLEKYG